jgi:hypothetical protein
MGYISGITPTPQLALAHCSDSMRPERWDSPHSTPVKVHLGECIVGKGYCLQGKLKSSNQTIKCGTGSKCQQKYYLDEIQQYNEVLWNSK